MNTALGPQSISKFPNFPKGPFPNFPNSSGPWIGVMWEIRKSERTPPNSLIPKSPNTLMRKPCSRIQEIGKCFFDRDLQS